MLASIRQLALKVISILSRNKCKHKNTKVEHWMITKPGMEYSFIEVVVCEDCGKDL
jgi:hypothetical protein